MVTANIIASICKNGGIANNLYIPWNFSNSYMTSFNNLTRGDGNNAVLMGKNTYNDILIYNHKPLSDRKNIILSKNISDNEILYTNVEQYNSIDEVINSCNKNNYDELWIIGGERVFKDSINNLKIKNIYLNHIDKEYNCNKYFPININKNEMKIINKVKHDDIEETFTYISQTNH